MEMIKCPECSGKFEVDIDTKEYFVKCDKCTADIEVERIAHILETKKEERKKRLLNGGGSACGIIMGFVFIGVFCVALALKPEYSWVWIICSIGCFCYDELVTIRQLRQFEIERLLKK